MAVEFLYCGANYDAVGRSLTDSLGEGEGPVVLVANGDASDPLGTSGLYEIVALDDCRVAFSPTATDGTNGLTWHARKCVTRYLDAGTKIGVSAL